MADVGRRGVDVAEVRPPVLEGPPPRVRHARRTRPASGSACVVSSDRRRTGRRAASRARVGGVEVETPTSRAWPPWYSSAAYDLLRRRRSGPQHANRYSSRCGVPGVVAPARGWHDKSLEPRDAAVAASSVELGLVGVGDSGDPVVRMAAGGRSDEVLVERAAVHALGRRPRRTPARPRGARHGRRRRRRRVGHRDRVTRRGTPGVVGDVGDRASASVERRPISEPQVERHGHRAEPQRHRPTLDAGLERQRVVERLDGAARAAGTRSARCAAS